MERDDGVLDFSETNIPLEDREFDRKLANGQAELLFWKKCRIIQISEYSTIKTTQGETIMTKPEINTIVTVPKPYTVELIKRPYPRVKPGSVLVTLITQFKAKTAGF